MSNLAHEDAVNEFLQAEEPILVEVKRRQCNTTTTFATADPTTPTTPNAINSSERTVTVINDGLPSNKLSSGKSIVFGAQQLDELKKSFEHISIGIQTELTLNDFENDYICQSVDSPIRVEHHLNNSQINHSGQLNSSNNNNNSSNNNNNNNSSSGSNNNNGHHHSLHHCTMLNECIVPPEIDIEVSLSFDLSHLYAIVIDVHERIQQFNIFVLS